MQHNVAIKGSTFLARRGQIHRLELELAKLPQIELKVEHHFAPGVYMRTMFIPAGVALVGHIHKQACISIVQYGDIVVATENGLRRLVGPCTLESPAGMKRAGWAQADTLFTTVHANPTDERDVDRLEDFLIATEYNDGLTPPDYPAFLERLEEPHALAQTAP